MIQMLLILRSHIYQWKFFSMIFSSLAGRMVPLSRTICPEAKQCYTTTTMFDYSYDVFFPKVYVRTRPTHFKMFHFW